MIEKLTVVSQEYDSSLLPFMFNEAMVNNKRLWKRMGATLKIFVSRARTEDNIIDLAVDKKNWREVGLGALKKYRRKKAIKEVEEVQRKSSEKLVELLNKLKPDEIKKSTNNRLAFWVSQLLKLDTEICIYGWSFVPIDFVNNLLTDKLNDILRKKKKEGRMKKKSSVYFSILTRPYKGTFSLKQQKDALGLAILFKNKKFTSAKRDSLIERHWKKYLWINFGFHGKPITKEFFEKEIKNLTKKNCKAMLESIKEEKRELKKEVITIHKELNLSKEEKVLFKLAREMVYLKGTRKEALVLSYYLLDLLAREFARRTFVPITELRCLTPTELIDWMKKGIQPPLSELKERKRIAVLVSTPKGKIVLSGKKAEIYWNKNVKKERISKKEIILKGQVASPGMVIGRVKIVNSVEEAKEFNENDVMVSHATQPELVPIMKKSSAIITEQGGMTCHAAIVSRELNKPCIVGVKAVTKKLKNNELIEVNASHGIIKRIESLHSKN